MLGAWADAVTHYWFDELEEAQWFKRDNAVDATIVEQFMETYEAVRAAPVAELTRDPRTAVAAVIVMDQFSRNMFRDSPRAFESDAKAVQVAEAAIGAGLDKQMRYMERYFLYMPFMHSEELAHQDRCIALFEALGSDQGVKYAGLHRDIIAQFGRFPHRNDVLGRNTSADEQAHLDEHGGF